MPEFGQPGPNLQNVVGKPGYSFLKTLRRAGNQFLHVDPRTGKASVLDISKVLSGGVEERALRESYKYGLVFKPLSFQSGTPQHKVTSYLSGLISNIETEKQAIPLSFWQPVVHSKPFTSKIRGSGYSEHINAIISTRKSKFARVIRKDFDPLLKQIGYKPTDPGFHAYILAHEGGHAVQTAVFGSPLPVTREVNNSLLEQYRKAVSKKAFNVNTPKDVQADLVRRMEKTTPILYRYQPEEMVSDIFATSTMKKLGIASSEQKEIRVPGRLAKKISPSIHHSLRGFETQGISSRIDTLEKVVSSASFSEIRQQRRLNKARMRARRSQIVLIRPILKTPSQTISPSTIPTTPLIKPSPIISPSVQSVKSLPKIPVPNNKYLYKAAGLALGLGVIGNFLTRKKEQKPQTPMYFPTDPMPLGQLEHTMEQSIEGNRFESLYTIGDFSKYEEERFRQGKAGLVQELHRTAHQSKVVDPRTKYFYLGNTSLPYLPPRNHPVKSRAGTI